MNNVLTIKFFKFYAIAFIFIIGGVVQAEDSQRPGDFEHRFSSLEGQLDSLPDNLDAGGKLRNLCRKHKLISRCVDSLNKLSEKYPKNKTIRYHAALAYVDMVPGHTLFKQGWFSTRSMDHMSDVLKDHPSDWNALYIRGLNGIFWPNSFRRLPGAIRDLQRCIEISSAMPVPLKRPYQVLAYIALGDALVKNGDIALALSIYGEGTKLQKSPKLTKRLSMNTDELTNYVKEARDRNMPVDTDISYLLDGGLDRL